MATRPKQHIDLQLAITKRRVIRVLIDRLVLANHGIVAILRNILYIDGGSLWWQPGLENGDLGTPISEGDFRGVVMILNLTHPPETSGNITQALLSDALLKSPQDGSQASPFYIDGALLHNDDQAFFYGGAVFRNDDLYPLPASDSVPVYRAYSYGDEKPLWRPSFTHKTLDDGVDMYITSGAGASAPSENKAWYFSGLTSPGGQILSTTGRDQSGLASIVSSRLIQVDMAVQNDEKWTNTSLPELVHGRANPEAVWVPVGEQGILVILGGVVYPEWAGTRRKHKSDDEDANAAISPGFIENIDVYDVKSKTWFQQPSTGGPRARTRACAVVAAAKDGSSFNIYFYGGFDGLNPTSAFNDDVWVLSLPSFVWIKINGGHPSHARAGHRCVRPFPDQMMVIGGYTSQSGTTMSCLDQGPIVMFNLSSGAWQSYEGPTDYKAYAVPSQVQEVIGGDASGGATVTGPSSWATSALASVMRVKYDTERLSTSWPTPGTPRATWTDLPIQEDSSAAGIPAWSIATVCSIVGVAVVVAVIAVSWKIGLCGRRSSAASPSHPSISAELPVESQHTQQREKPFGEQTTTTEVYELCVGNNDPVELESLHPPRFSFCSGQIDTLRLVKPGQDSADSDLVSPASDGSHGSQLPVIMVSPVQPRGLENYPSIDQRTKDESPPEGWI